MKECPICLSQFYILEEHHIWPKAYGGPEDGKLFNLCSSCHHSVHLQAEALSRTPKNGKKRKQYLTEDQIRRATGLISVIIRSKLVWKEDKINKNNQPKKILLEIDNTMLTRLHKIKKDKGFKSLKSYLVFILKKEISINL